MLSINLVPRHNDHLLSLVFLLDSITDSSSPHPLSQPLHHILSALALTAPPDSPQRTKGQGTRITITATLNRTTCA